MTPLWRLWSAKGWDPLRANTWAIRFDRNNSTTVVSIDVSYVNRLEIQLTPRWKRFFQASDIIRDVIDISGRVSYLEHRRPAWEDAEHETPLRPWRRNPPSWISSAPCSPYWNKKGGEFPFFFFFFSLISFCVSGKWELMTYVRWWNGDTVKKAESHLPGK